VSERRLIVNADDFGLHRGINAGVLTAHREGVVTSASLSTNGAAFSDAVALAQASPSLAVGVHLTLVGEPPVSDPKLLPTLAPDGRLPHYFTSLFRRLLLGRIDLAEIERELVAQVARASDAGIVVSHLDSHQHAHLHPTIAPIVARVARRFGIRAVRAARRIVGRGALRPLLLAPFSRLAAARFRKESLRTPDVCLGLRETGSLDEARLLELLERLPTGSSELVCHPGTDDQAIARDYAWGFRWDEETRALTSPRVKEKIRASGITLVSYRDL
jgi:hopanoid biosynthesis associated protein HpnK